MVKRCALLLTMLLLVPFVTVNGSDDLEQALRLDAIRKNEANNEREAECTTNALRIPFKKAAFPSLHPSTAVSSIFGRWSEYYKIYIWRDNGSVWVEIEPLFGSPFVCTTSFIFIVGGVQYDTVKLVTQGGSSQCGDVYVPSVYELTQWSFYTSKADLNRAFSLQLDGGDKICTIDVPSESSASNQLVEDFVTRFYQQCLNRDPDTFGLSYWVDSLVNSTKCGDDVANGFVFSQEFLNQNTSNEDYLKVLYKAFFNRLPDSAGFNVWLEILNSASIGDLTTRETVLNGFVGSQEFTNLCQAYGIDASNSPIQSSTYQNGVGEYQLKAFEAIYQNGINYNSTNVPFSGSLTIHSNGYVTQTVTFLGVESTRTLRVDSVGADTAEIVTDSCAYTLGFQVSGDILVTDFAMDTCGSTYSELDIWEKVQ